MTKGKKALIITGSIVLGLVILCLAIALGFGGSYYDKSGKYVRIKGTNSFSYISKHPALEGFGEYTSPFEQGTALYDLMKPMRFSYIAKVFGMQGHIAYDTQANVDGLNFLIDMKEEGKLTVMDIYSQAEKEIDNSKESTKLIYVASDNANAPFALVCAGGGLNAVVMMHEAFPIAEKLHEEGYNVFMLKYRVGAHEGEEDEDIAKATKLQRAMEDVAKAYEVIFANSLGLDYSTENYSMWGFSAGGRLTGNWALLPDYGYMTTDIPAPAMICLGYAYIDANYVVIREDTPAVYSTVGGNDKKGSTQGGVIGATTLINKLDDNGVQTVHDFFEGKDAVGHGFGRGDGTPAEGWMDKAIALWEGQINR